MAKPFSRLGYPAEWVAYGLLDEAFLAEQLAQYEAGKDSNCEHYRFAAFKTILEQPELSDTLVERFVQLAELDPDQAMATAAVAELIDHPSLSEDQLRKLESMATAKSVLSRRIRRVRLLRELRSVATSPQVLQRCAIDGDAMVHRALLDRQELPDSILEHLQHKGANRAIRNSAGRRRSCGTVR